MPTVPAIEIWNFHIFSKFIKFHQTYRIYWNHHLKQLQNLLESSWNILKFGEVEMFHEKMPTEPAIEILWNFIKLTEFTGIIIWNMHVKNWVHSEKLKFFMKKCRQCQEFIGYQKSEHACEYYEIFPDNAGFSKFRIYKFHQTYRIYWNHHLKHHHVKFESISKVHQISSNCRSWKMWNFNPIEKLKNFMKNADRAGYRNI